MAFSVTTDSVPDGESTGQIEKKHSVKVIEEQSKRKLGKGLVSEITQYPQARKTRLVER